MSLPVRAIDTKPSTKNPPLFQCIYIKLYLHITSFAPRSELSTPKYEYAEEFVQYEIARELAMQAESNTKWVSLDAKTKTISYNEAADGSTIPDFSHVGYHGDGARSLPSRDDIPALATLMAASDGAGDDTARIQAALDEVGAAPMSSVNGYRGAVVLNAGTFRIADPLVMRHDGVVLRGAGVVSGAHC